MERSSVVVFDSPSEEATRAFGRALAEVVPDGTTIALCGTLGAGKTRLVQAVAEGAGVESGKVVSPTFVLVQHYRGLRTIHHVDTYRLRDEDEFQELGPEELFESEGLTFVEWADRVENCLPLTYLRIEIGVTGARSRHFSVRAEGVGLERCLEQLARAAQSIQSEFPAERA